jgi:hypothetical protein
MEKISRSVRKAKQAKFGMLTVPVRTVRTDTCQSVQLTWQVRTVTWANQTVADGDTWQTWGDRHVATRGSTVQMTWANSDDTWQAPYGGHVASPGRDTCHADLALLAYDWTNMR